MGTENTMMNMTTIDKIYCVDCGRGPLWNSYDCGWGPLCMACYNEVNSDRPKSVEPIQPVNQEGTERQ